MENPTCIRTATRVVCKNCLPASGGWLPHVTQCIDRYLTGSLRHDVLSAACEAGASIHTLDWVLEKTAPVWREAVQAAVRGGHLHVLRWMTERDDGCGPWRGDFYKNLELAARHGHLNLAKWLFKRGVDEHTQDSNGKFEKTWRYEHCTADALSLAAEHGHLKVVQWIYNTRTAKCSRVSSPVNKAVANGHLSIAKWLHQVKQEGQEQQEKEAECSVEAVDEAGQNGHLHMLKWLHSNNLFTCSSKAMERAARNGHFDVVKWLHRVHHECCSPLVLNEAVGHGNLELVKWLYENASKCFLGGSDVSVTTAAGCGNLSVLKWAHQHALLSFSVQAMDAAASNGHMDIISWLHDHQLAECSASAVSYAAWNGHLNVLKWLHTRYPTAFQPDLMADAAYSGHLDVVRWLQENYPRCNDALSYATAGGHLDIFLYLLKHRTERFSLYEEIQAQNIRVLCHFGPKIRRNQRRNRATRAQLKTLRTVFQQRPAFLRTCLRCLASAACATGNVAILDWVNQFGLELPSLAPARNAVRIGDLKLLQWLWENGFEATDPMLLKLAIEYSHLDIIHWLVERGYDVNSLELIKFAENASVLRFLVEHGPPLDLATARHLILENRNIEIAWWVPEDVRKLLVLDALQDEDEEVLWWILAHTKFQGESVRNSIRDAIQCAPKDTKQWLQANLRNVEACCWCFPTSNKRRTAQ